MAATAIPNTARESFVLEGVSFELYERLVQELAGQHVFVTFDRGRLEFMSPSPEHEWWKILIGRLIEMLALERAVAAEGLGSTTFKRGDLARGLEPDECYYLRGAGELRRKREADLPAIHLPTWWWRSTSRIARSTGRRSMPPLAWPRCGGSMDEP